MCTSSVYSVLIDNIRVEVPDRIFTAIYSWKPNLIPKYEDLKFTGGNGNILFLVLVLPLIL